MLDYAFSFSFLSSKEVTPDRPAKHTQSTKHPEPERHVCAIRQFVILCALQSQEDEDEVEKRRETTHTAKPDEEDEETDEEEEEAKLQGPK